MINEFGAGVCDALAPSSGRLLRGMATSRRGPWGAGGRHGLLRRHQRHVAGAGLCTSVFP